MWRPRHPRTALCVAAVALVVVLALLPAVALACPIAIRTIGPIDGSRTDLVRPVTRTTTRAAWGLDDSWTSTMPKLSQFVKLRHVGTFHGVSFRTQRALSIDARGPRDNGWMYLDDDLPETPPCQLIGQIEWQAPKIRVVQGRREIRIAATSQRTEGDRTGCILGPDLGVRPCPNLTRVVINLAQPVGRRAIVFETFP